MPKNNLFPVANHLRYSFLYLNLLLSILILLTGFSMNAFGQVLIPLSQLNSRFPEKSEPDVYTLKAFGDQLFVGKEDGLWIVSKDGSEAKKVEQVIGRVLDIEEIGDQLFVGAEQPSLPVSREDDYIFWIVSKDGSEARKVEQVKERVLGIVLFGDQLFVKTLEGLWIVSKDGTEARKVEQVKRRVQAVSVFGNLLFIDADIEVFDIGGVVRVAGGGLSVIKKDGAGFNKVPSIKGSANDLDALGDQVFIGTEYGLWVVSKDGTEAKKVKSIEGRVNRIEAFGDQLFVGKEDGLWIVSKDGSEAKKVEQVNEKVPDIKLFGDQLFINTPAGLWIINKDGTRTTKVEEIKDYIYDIVGIGDQLFVHTYRDLWVIRKDGTRTTKVKSIKEAIHGIETVGEYIYIHTTNEMTRGRLHRLDPKVIINTKLAPSNLWGTGIQYILPSKWLLSEKVQVNACYSYSDEKCDDPYDKTIPREFRFTKAVGAVEPSEDRFSTQEQFSYEIGWGKNDVHYWVKDKWGNTFEQRAIYYGIPSQYFFAGVLLILPAIFVLGCLALAPKIGFCHSAIMNPWLRKYFSLGSVPLLLSIFPSLRRYILRRYSNSVNNDKEFTEWKKRFICPNEEFLPENFGEKLERERRLLLTGQSGIGKTSFFKHLTAHYVSQNKPPFPAKVLPVYIPLTNFGGNSLEDLVYNQLFSYGKITDKELAPMFLEQGQLLIFLDGVNEVQNVADRQKLSAFVERFWTSNYFCLSSQQSYPEIENIPKVELKSFSREIVCEFIRLRVNAIETAENVIRKLTDEDYQLYSIPRDLEFAIEILNRGEKSLPRSRTELYKITLSSIFAKWKENGAVDAEDNLCKHSYTMIVQRDLAFDSVDNPRFKEITLDLFEQKFLVRREGSYNFRHDLIRSYLASEYFYSRWKSLFEEVIGKSIDSNWLEMLKFSCENIGDSIEVKNLVYEVLNKSVRKDLVKNLFEWLKANHPSKCKSWEKEFYAKYGELDFK